jgi:hypothetical protein
MTITLTREEAQLVLDALEYPGSSWFDARKPAAELLRARLAQPEPEPVAWRNKNNKNRWQYRELPILIDGEPLFTAIPQLKDNQ